MGKCGLSSLVGLVLVFVVYSGGCLSSYIVLCVLFVVIVVVCVFILVSVLV